MITWTLLPFSSLTTHQLYALLKLRTNVFVVEQNCPYPELDDKDTKQDVYHLLGYQQLDDGQSEPELVAYARLLPPGVSYPQVSIGRVAVAESARGQKLGHALVDEALKGCEQAWPGQDIQIGAQVYLEAFYKSFGFTRQSEDYLEDGIPHVDMLLSKA